MSFSIWNERPPFECAADDREQIYQVGDKWVVTDNQAKATQENIDDALKPQATPDPTKAELLVQINAMMAKVEALP